MSGLSTLEESKIIPIIEGLFKTSHGGVTLDDIRDAIRAKGYDLTRERIMYLVAVLRCAGSVSLRVSAAGIRFVPADEAYVSFAMVH